jgi:hypothetical protein
MSVLLDANGYEHSGALASVGKGWRGMIATLSFAPDINQIRTISCREQEWHLILFYG